MSKSAFEQLHMLTRFFFSLKQDMHYAEFAEDEVSNFVRLTALVINKNKDH